jgi:hypothetical protein
MWAPSDRSSPPLYLAPSPSGRRAKWWSSAAGMTPPLPSFLLLDLPSSWTNPLHLPLPPPLLHHMPPLPRTLTLASSLCLPHRADVCPFPCRPSSSRTLPQSDASHCLAHQSDASASAITSFSDFATMEDEAARSPALRWCPRDPPRDVGARSETTQPWCGAFVAKP